MTPIERPAVLVLGAGQCVNWGVLYYAFGALVLPLERALAVSRAVAPARSRSRSSAAALDMAGGYVLVFGASALALGALAAHWWLVRARSL